MNQGVQRCAGITSKICPFYEANANFCEVVGDRKNYLKPNGQFFLTLWGLAKQLNRKIDELLMGQNSIYAPSRLSVHHCVVQTYRLGAPFSTFIGLFYHFLP